MNLIPTRLLEAHSANYTGAPDVQAFIADLTEERAPETHVLAYLKRKADEEAYVEWARSSQETRLLDVPKERARRCGPVALALSIFDL